MVMGFYVGVEVMFLQRKGIGQRKGVQENIYLLYFDIICFFKIQGLAEGSIFIVRNFQ